MLSPSPFPKKVGSQPWGKARGVRGGRTLEGLRSERHRQERNPGQTVHRLCCLEPFTASRA